MANLLKYSNKLFIQFIINHKAYRHMLPAKLWERYLNAKSEQACCAKYIKMETSDSTKVLCIRLFLFSIYVLAGAATFQAIERQAQVREIERIRSTRKEILMKYNITQNDEQRWSKTFLSTSLGNDDFLEWNFGNSFLFAMVVITTIGKINEKYLMRKSNPLNCKNILKLSLLSLAAVCDLNIYLTFITFLDYF